MNWFSQLTAVLTALLAFAAFFGALAVVVKGRRLIRDIAHAWPEIRTNLGLHVLDAILVVPIVGLPGAIVVQQLGVNAQLGAFWSQAGLIPTCVAAVIIGDYIGYWRHRFEHSRLLWPSHATHHSDRAMNWLTLNRMHPINRLSTITIDITLLVLLGFPAWAIIANGFVRNAWGYFIHADLPWTLGKAGTLLISPSAHRWHHARDERLSGTNFATLFTLWDRWHGTYQPSPEPCRIETGVEGHSGGLLFELAHPFRVMVRTALRAFTRA